MHARRVHRLLRSNMIDVTFGLSSQAGHLTVAGIHGTITNSKMTPAMSNAWRTLLAPNHKSSSLFAHGSTGAPSALSRPPTRKRVSLGCAYHFQKGVLDNLKLCDYSTSLYSTLSTEVLLSMRWFFCPSNVWTNTWVCPSVHLKIPQRRTSEAPGKYAIS
jgi:hypothetical protein